MSKLEERLAKQLDDAGVKYERELMLIPGRRFRFDFVIPQACLVIEAEGGTWSGIDPHFGRWSQPRFPVMVGNNSFD